MRGLIRCRVLADSWPETLKVVASGVVAAALLFGFIGVSAFFAIWLERKVAGRIQDRLGPTRVGGKFGWLQTLADGIKLLVKEDLIPDDADHFLFRLGPYIAFCASFVAFLALPFGNGLVGLGIEHRRVLHARRHVQRGVRHHPGRLRLRQQVVAVRRHARGGPDGQLRSAAGHLRARAGHRRRQLNLNTIGSQQTGWFWNWYLFHDPFTFVAFWIFFTCATASCKRAPFDLAEAESELVAGFHTEYTGLRWSFFFMAEYGSMFAVSGIAALLFLGGWHTGLLPFEPSVDAAGCAGSAT